MKESIRHWKQIIETSEEGVAVVDLQGNFIYYNQSYRHMFGMDETITSVFQLIVPERRHEMQELLQQTLDGYVKPSGESRMQRCDTGEWCDLRLAANPFYSEHGQVLGCVILVYDITKEVHARRMKREYLDMLAHDLRTPLTVIRGVVQSLRYRMEKGKVISREQHLQELLSVERSTDSLMDRIAALILLFRSDDHE